MARSKPPLEHRMVFFMGLRRQRCRFNESLNGYFQLPPILQRMTQEKWRDRHPRMSIPKFEVSKKPRRRKS